MSNVSVEQVDFEFHDKVNRILLMQDVLDFMRLHERKSRIARLIGRSKESEAARRVLSHGYYTRSLLDSPEEKFIYPGAMVKFPVFNAAIVIRDNFENGHLVADKAPLATA